MSSISKKVLYFSVFSLFIFMSGNFGHGDFWGIKKAFGYGGGGGSSGYLPPVVKPAPVIVSAPPQPLAPVPVIGPTQVLGVATFKFNRNLMFGSKGDDVLELQKKLTQEGVYTGPLTGYFGPLTLAGVKRFQAKNNLETVGNTGPLTRALLNIRLTTVSTLATETITEKISKTPVIFKFLQSLMFGSKGDDVLELQKKLTQEGVYTGPLTGYFGPLTLAGVKRFQAKNNLDQVGIVGPLTRALLNKNN